MDRESLKYDLTLMLIALSSWTEGEGDLARAVAWKGYDLGVLDALDVDGYVRSGDRGKSLTLTEEGRQHALELLEAYDIKLDPDPAVQRFFRLSLRFDFAELNCTRTLLVPQHTTFEDFHTQIQACFNWMNYHLYDFGLTVGGEELCLAWPDYETGGDPREDFFIPGEVPPRWLNAATTYLDDLLPRTHEMVYSYDYGDGWRLRITLLNHGERFASDVPFCWEGSGDAPPEDVGGEGGFEHFLQVMDDPSHEDYEWLKGWGEGQGFERFSKLATNRRLARWRDWSRADTNEMPREAQLAAFGKVIAPPAGEGAGAGPRLTVIDGGRDWRDESLSRRLEDNGASEEDKDACLAAFGTYLHGQGLKQKTIDDHLFNVEFYLKTYLKRLGNASVQDGVGMLGGFLGDFFIHECMWSTKTSIKHTATSIKKFYRCMALHGVVTQAQYRELSAEIKESLPEWIAGLEAWDGGAPGSWF